MKTGLTLTQLAQEIERRAKAKDDFVVSTKDIEMIESLDLVINGGDKVVGVNKIAHDQIATHTKIPRDYYNRMLADDPRLLATNVNTWFRKNPIPRMVRCLDHTARALLSDRYRPLENEDLAEAVLPPIMEMGLDVMSSQITDNRLYIKCGRSQGDARARGHRRQVRGWRAQYRPDARARDHDQQFGSRAGRALGAGRGLRRLLLQHGVLRGAIHPQVSRRLEA